MRSIGVWLAGWLVGCGGSSASNPSDAGVATDAAVARDARSVDAPGPAICDPLARFDSVVMVDGIASAGLIETAPHLTSDELAIYFSASLGVTGTSQLYAAHRSAVTTPFRPPNLLPAVNLAFDGDPTVSPDGLELWFDSTHGTTGGHLRLWGAARASTSDDFSAPVSDPYIDTGDPDVSDRTPFLTADGEQLWFVSSRPISPFGGPPSFDSIWYATREGRSFTTPRVEPQFAGTAQAFYSNPVLSADRLTIYVLKTETVTVGQSIWRSRRSTVLESFPPPSRVDELHGVPGWLSADNCRLYLGGAFISVATRHP